MSILSKHQRWFAFFLSGLFAVIALSFAALKAIQPSAEVATNAWGDQAAPAIARVLVDSANSHQEPNFYQ